MQTCTSMLQSKLYVQLCTSSPCPIHETMYVKAISDLQATSE